MNGEGGWEMLKYKTRLYCQALTERKGFVWIDKEMSQIAGGPVIG